MFIMFIIIIVIIVIVIIYYIYYWLYLSYLLLSVLLLLLLLFIIFIVYYIYHIYYILLLLPEKGWNESQRLLFDSRGGAWNSTSSIWHGSNMKRPNINNCYRVIIVQSLNGPF